MTMITIPTAVEEWWKGVGTYHMHMMFNMLMHDRIKVTGLLDGFSCFAYRLPAILYHPSLRALASWRRVQERQAFARLFRRLPLNDDFAGFGVKPSLHESSSSVKFKCIFFTVDHFEVEIYNNVRLNEILLTEIHLLLYFITSR